MSHKVIKQTIVSICFLLCFLLHVYVQQAQAVNQEEPEERQVDRLCGPNSLFIIFALLGVEAERDGLAEMADINERGTTLYGLRKAAIQHGLYAVGVETTLSQLRKLPPPMIAHVSPDHFFVVNGFEGDWVHIIDPPENPSSVHSSDFGKIWTGKALIVSREELEIAFPRPLYITAGLLLLSLVCVAFFIFVLIKKARSVRNSPSAT